MSNGEVRPQPRPSLSATISAASAGPISSAPRQSKRRSGDRLLVFGKMNQPASAPASPNGTLIQNADRQPSVSRSTPPSAGPSARPIACAAPWMPRARPRSAGAAAPTTMAMLFAASKLAPIASKTRKATRSGRVGATLHSAEPSTKRRKPPV